MLARCDDAGLKTDGVCNMNGQLTAEQKEAYLLNSGACPVCRSGNIEGQEHDYEGDQVWQTIVCVACGKKWRDVFTLTMIEDIA